MPNENYPKIILVAYIGVSNVPSHERMVYIEQVKQVLSGKKDGILTYFIPVAEENSRIECIYPNVHVVDAAVQKENADRLIAALENIAANFPYLTDGTQDIVP